MANTMLPLNAPQNAKAIPETNSVFGEWLRQNTMVGNTQNPQKYFNQQPQGIDFSGDAYGKFNSTPFGGSMQPSQLSEQQDTNAFNIPTASTDQDSVGPAPISSVDTDGTINRATQYGVGESMPDNSTNSMFSDDSSMGIDFGNLGSTTSFSPEAALDSNNAFNAVTGGYDSGVGGIDLGGTTPPSNWWDDMGGLTGALDMGGKAVDIGSKLFSAWNGMKTTEMAQDAFDFNKATTNRNIANTAQSLNTSLEDRQNARVASNPNAYTGTSAYMAKNKLNGSAIG